MEECFGGEPWSNNKVVVFLWSIIYEFESWKILLILVLGKLSTSHFIRCDPSLDLAWTQNTLCS